MSADIKDYEAKIRSLENELRLAKKTLRDNFALGLATGAANNDDIEDIKAFSRYCYRFADAMMEARK